MAKEQNHISSLSDFKDLCTLRETEWSRSKITAKNDMSRLQVFYIDSVYDEPIQYEGVKENIRLFGCSNGGSSVCVNVKDFLPRMYVILNKKIDEKETTAMVAKLNNKLAQVTITLNHKKTKYDLKKHGMVLSIRGVPNLGVGVKMKSNEKVITFLEILVQTQIVMETLLTIFGKEKDLKIYLLPTVSDLSFRSMFLLSCKAEGCSWIQLKNAKFLKEDQKQTSCQHEVAVDWKDVVWEGKNKDDEYAPMRVLACNILCVPNETTMEFAKNGENPVLAISNIILWSTDLKSVTESAVNIVFILGTCEDINGWEVVCFKHENEMLLAWQELVKLTDPDLITSYSHTNNDVLYLLERGFNTLKIKNFGNIRRDLVKSWKNLNPYMKGRLEYNMRDNVMHPRLASLCQVTKERLNQQNQKFSIEDIVPLYTTSEKTRRQLAENCLKDTLFCLDMFDTYQFIMNDIIKANMFGVSLRCVKNMRSLASTKMIQTLERKEKPLLLMQKVFYYFCKNTNDNDTHYKNMGDENFVLLAMLVADMRSSCASCQDTGKPGHPSNCNCDFLSDDDTFNKIVAAVLVDFMAELAQTVKNLKSVKEPSKKKHFELIKVLKIKAIITFISCLGFVDPSKIKNSKLYCLFHCLQTSCKKGHSELRQNILESKFGISSVTDLIKHHAWY